MSKNIDGQIQLGREERPRIKPGVACPQPHGTTFLTFPVALHSRTCCGQLTPGRRRRRAEPCPSSGRPSKIPGHWGLVPQRLMWALVIVQADIPCDAAVGCACTADDDAATAARRMYRSEQLDGDGSKGHSASSSDRNAVLISTCWCVRVVYRTVSIVIRLGMGM
jgi:hypothetical protein